MSDFPPPPPWTAGFRAQRAAAAQESGDQPSPPRKARGDKWEWLILTALLALVVVVLVLK